MKFNKEEKNDEKNEKLEDEEGTEQEQEQEQAVDIDNQELDKVLKENEELTGRFQRLQADFVNYKKRVEKEKEGLISYGVESLVVEILPILDNFERALETEQDKDDQFFKGIQMIHDGLIQVLNRNNIHEMDSLDKPFNPDLHHAVGVEETEEADKDTVVRILQKGYIIKDKVVRPAMVMVSK